ncbi:MAG TPA: cell division protein FtsQ/DivIB [Solirubrobacterales bacterium]|nr:cell division protein FtsQ/DivIB [Solirubrobacterales bacterium]
MRRVLLAIVAVLVLVGIAYQLLGRESTVEPRVILPRPTTTIGTGSEAVGVSADGVILDWLTLSEDAQLPRLPLSEPPAKERLGGPLLQQALVLGAAPAALRPYVESSYYGDSGVDVELTSGIELRFGDATRAAEKWKAAAAVLANPSITALDSVDLHAPRRPAVDGSGHALPPLP